MKQMFLFLMFIVYAVGQPLLTFAEPIALYRFVGIEGDHFYTSSCDEKHDAVAKHKYAKDGVAGYVETTQTEGTTPFYRLWRPKNHFYTANADERNTALKAGYRDEGIAGYLRPVGDARTTALYRSFNANSGDHFYTTKKYEHDDAITKKGYKDEGIAGFIWNKGIDCPVEKHCGWHSDGQGGFGCSCKCL